VALCALALLALSYWLWTPDKDAAQLRGKYLAKPGDMVEVLGTTLHVRDTGPRDAPAVVLVHGFGSSLQTWDTWATALEADHRVIRIDLPGSGLSPPDASGQYVDARSIALLIALQDRLGVPRASIVGHSIGGRIAWTFAARYPERVDKLVLVSPDGFASPGFAYGVAPKVPSMLGLMRFVLPKPLLRMNLAPAYADPALLTDALTTRYHDLLLAPGAREAMLMRMRQTVLVDPVPLLQRIRAPTLLVWGERDAMIPLANANDYLKAMPNARLVTVPGAGHLPHEEAPGIAMGEMRRFLDGS
jgi:pimeloyl-ACP methyl ester carboxylesterase